ncbi:hypothetical protein [Nocardia sp. IFM 10818]
MVDVSIAELEIALVRHDPERAIRLAATVELPEELPLERRIAYHVCQARASLMRRDDTAATLVLMRIANISPEAIRFDVGAYHCVQQLLRRDNPLTRTEVAHLARLAGISA